MVEYLKGPLDGWVMIRNITKKSTQADWLPVHCLADEAYENKPKSVKKMESFAAFHHYEGLAVGDSEKKLTIEKGDELEFISGPVNGWLYVRFVSTRQELYVPYWILPHGLRPTEDHGHETKKKAGVILEGKIQEAQVGSVSSCLGGVVWSCACASQATSFCAKNYFEAGV